MSDDKPDWYPMAMTEGFIARRRDDFRERKYITDLMSDSAYKDYERLADAYLELVKENEELKKKYNDEVEWERLDPVNLSDYGIQD